MTTTPKSEFEREPREFWIKEGMPDIVLPIEEYERQKRERLHMTGIHVIEYSAYAAAQKEIERLNVELEEYKSGFNILERRSQDYFAEIVEKTNKNIEWDKAFQEKLKENNQLRDLLQEMRDALSNLAAERCEGKTPCRVQYAHDLVDKADEKLKRLRGE